MVFKKILQGLTKKTPITYEMAKELAQNGDTKVRLELAGCDDIKPELLYYLAEDKDPAVRRAIAANISTPRMADLLLVADEDHEVRVGMAEKIALLAPGLNADEQDSIRKMTYEALEILARDQMTRVRQILAETLKDVADAPPEVIRQLARDVELVVSGPILEFSPVLSVDDLLEIIANEPISGALGAVSRRHDLGEAVSTAIAASDDQEAITSLLANKSAQIREETLNNLIDRAVDCEAWHEPLAHRPKLPVGAAGRLARFVAGNLLDILTARKDLDEQTANEVRTIVNRRLDEEQSEEADEESADIETISPSKMKTVRELNQEGGLTPDRLNEALQKGERDFAAAALVVMSDLEEKAVMHAISMRSAKAIVAIAWKASLEPWLVEQLQLRMCKIPKEDVLTTPAGENYPLSEEDMNWQINFLKDLAK
ncbi:MAG: DUF2336 domain-containing protein [Rhodospirillaceae bacterium]|nr:DUF2336 domain-containing protein [Rhodospirillaceae bacterium]MBL6940804.1 DUF2336 domain-containing protein [Rhodospirillales bacterium]